MEMPFSLRHGNAVFLHTFGVTSGSAPIPLLGLWPNVLFAQSTP